MPKYNTFISTASHIVNISKPSVMSVYKHPNFVRKTARLIPAKIIFYPCKDKSICNTFILTFDFDRLGC